MNSVQKKEVLLDGVSFVPPGEDTGHGKMYSFF